MNRPKDPVAGLFAVVLAGLLLVPQGALAQQQARPDKDEIPQNVMDALKARFPRAEIDKWTVEKEGDLVIYDFEFRQDGQKFEADIKRDGTFHNWEQQITYEDLPDPVKMALDEKYPNSTPREIMTITAVTDGSETLEGYEVLLATADQKQVEVTLAPDGQVVEESGEEN